MIDKKPMNMTTKELVDRATDNYSARDSLSYELAVRLDMLIENDSLDDSVRGWVRGNDYSLPTRYDHKSKQLLS